MRYTGTRLIDPAKGHERKAREAMGVKTARDLDDDVRVALEQAGNVPATVRPRITGSHLDGTASRGIVSALMRLGLVADETDDDPDPVNPPYENNAGLLFRGSVPGIAIGGSTIVGTGSPSLTLSNATDNSGRIVLVTGTAPSAAGVFATITFVRPKSTGNYAVLISPADPDAITRLAGSDFGGRTTTAFTVQNGTTFAAGTSYHYDYVVIEREQL
jgi:hypothetical protein